MVKGVNKTVIEINDTGNEMFEKIILYVAPHYSGLNAERIKREAAEVAGSFGNEPEYKKSLRRIISAKRKKRRNLIFAAAFLFAACTVAAVIFLL